MKTIAAGTTVRSVDLGPKVASEAFRVVLGDDQPADYLGWHSASARIVETQERSDIPIKGTALVLTKLLVNTDVGVNAFFDGNRLSKRRAIAVNLDRFDAMAHDEFWALIDTLGGRLSHPRVRALATSLANSNTPAVEGFEIQLRSFIQELLIARTRPPLDSSSWWAAAHIALGRANFERAMAAQPDSPRFSDIWEHGERLLLVASSAFEMRDGLTPDFVTEDDPPLDHSGQHVPEHLLPAVTSAEVEEALTTIVGSRFLVSVADGFIECIAVQAIRPRQHDQREVDLNALRFAEQLNGTLASPVEFQDTHTPDLFSGLTIFEVRRSWTGTFDEYVQTYVP